MRNSLLTFTLLAIIISVCDGDTHTRHILPQPASRIRNERESVWAEFVELGRKFRPLNMGQGFPDFAAPRELLETLETISRYPNSTEGPDSPNIKLHQYTAPNGHPNLLMALDKYYTNVRKLNSMDYLVTVGAYEALFISIMSFVEPGDQVILIDPAFDAYAPMVAMAGGKSVYVTLRFEGSNSTDRATSREYKIDLEELENKMKQGKTSVMILNNPHNPFGKIFTRQELEDIANLCMKYNVLVIADEVYEHLYYDVDGITSIAQVSGMRDRTITIGSAGKTFSVTGWKIGWAIAPKHLMRYLKLTHQTAVYTVATPLQAAVASMFENILQKNETIHYWIDLRADLLKNRNLMANLLAKANMRPIVPEGGYFMVADFSAVASKFPQYLSVGQSEIPDRSNSNDFRFARWLSMSKKLQGIPVSAFYSQGNKNLGENLIRFCFIKRETTMNEFGNIMTAMTREIGV